MPSEASAGEDTRVWIGRIASGHEAEHARFIEWLNSSAASAIFQRRRLTEYQLGEKDGVLTIVFKAPHTGDPRLMIDFLRYPGLWPEYWEFVRGGRAEDEPPPSILPDALKVHWRRTPHSTE